MREVKSLSTLHKDNTFWKSILAVRDTCVSYIAAIQQLWEVYSIFLRRIKFLYLWYNNIPLAYISWNLGFNYSEQQCNSHPDTNSGFVFLEPDFEFQEQWEKYHWFLGTWSITTPVLFVHWSMCVAIQIQTWCFWKQHMILNHEDLLKHNECVWLAFKPCAWLYEGKAACNSSAFLSAFQIYLIPVSVCGLFSF